MENNIDRIRCLVFANKLFVTQIFHRGQPIYSGDRKTFDVMIST